MKDAHELAGGLQKWQNMLSCLHSSPFNQKYVSFVGEDDGDKGPVHILCVCEDTQLSSRQLASRW